MLKVVKQCVSTEGVEAPYPWSDALPELLRKDRQYDVACIDLVGRTADRAICTHPEGHLSLFISETSIN